MNRLRRLPKFVLRLMRLPPRVVYALGLGALMGRLVLLLTTRGRKTGRMRTTPLQFEIDQDRLLIGSMRGERSDWFRNIVADNRVDVRLGRHRFNAVAEPITDTVLVTDFLELRLKQHPRMIGRMLQMEGLVPPWTREKLTRYAEQIAIVAIPLPDEMTVVESVHS